MNLRNVLSLVYDSNTLYMDDEIKSVYCEDGIYMTHSYACGSVLTVSVLDFLASAVSSNLNMFCLKQLFVFYFKRMILRGAT